ncbi:MAG: restriction endonuclease subunit S [Nitrosomonas sp.]|uniref:restriction endonuclease subunit S n=1 Tax=Nitrosomonas sp. TaxID=42353 RepID=UPI00273111F1|nr:restriction endonuclease subunit S [Nitrosomonas sp.]MDP1549132.1 restriction endonuclease subunit S [Nitrosomonas sp.]
MSSVNFMEKLLDGVEVEWQLLEQVAKIKHGKDWKCLDAGDVPIYGSGGIMGYVDTYSYNKPSVLIPRKGSITNIFYIETPFWNVDTIFYTEIDESKIVPKFLYYFIKTIDMMALDTGAGRPSLTQAILNKIQIPIPCPENPKKSLEIQAEIVRILDAFTELTARKKQYNYYRDQLLSFEEGEGEVEWKTLGEVGEFNRGRRFTKADYVEGGIGCIHYGDIYTQYGTTAKVVKTHVRSDMRGTLRYAKHGDVVITDVGETVEDVGKPVAWLGIDDVAIHDHCYAFRHSMNPTFVSYCMQTTSFIAEKAKYVARTKVNTLLMKGFAKIRIPVPSPEEQARIVAILDKFDALTNSISEGLPREIALRQKQYEYYRDLLLSFPKPEEVAA